MSFQLVCNHKNCLKPISNVGWVTACLHIFCEDHGKQLKLRWQSMTCPACGTHFEEEFAINERVVNPSKEFKSVREIILCIFMVATTHQYQRLRFAMFFTSP